ncbi:MULTISPECIES: TauD/TfdA family dioxygenase [Vibrio harveyi group]|uniref:TauD/TfdA family dioxygenase n=1 Tax=Vibrio harveyi group TaxID=717610 RepID=UPI0009F064C8|nr:MULTISPECIES: TauD/TfdA family dioxygenase [Vibrio harveyi group]EKD1480595.1 TauD/TfdA family dioxygenase [Vibrio alginolyticus]MCG9718903.1 TauD/TfdA family dioxygenase [Vibrio alginolyticus]MCR9350117.1 TauD/TfdA family dioxygenase [Vibrio alginolyticus]MCR9363153.1 TauD/TfdA family dioxygenase [Vibrio alginolyticus]OQU02439.1 hypothetical protein EM85_002570 [Vibrio parahaemolyticus]
MEIKKDLLDKGFIFIPKWEVNQSASELASGLGQVVKISDYWNYSTIPVTQKLQPKKQSQSSNNQYSGEFGLDAFPLHTDLAHWDLPPKYLMLRCIKGYNQVSTKVLPLRAVWDLTMSYGLRRAVVKTRGKHGCMLPLFFKINGEYCLRWDPLFLEPLNENARAIKSLMLSDKVWDSAINVKLVNCGDTLIINNHLNLHARSSVPFECTGRVIERVYFN